MLDSDVDALNELLSQDLIFTNHLGQWVSKEEDLHAHKTGVVRLHELTPLDSRINIHGKVAIVSVLVYLRGSYNGVPGEGNFRFTRVWGLEPDGKLQVIAGHASVVA